MSLIPSDVAGRSSSARGAGVVLGVMLVSAFGPYVFGGVRTEQITVYLLGAVSVIGIAFRRPSKMLGLMLVFWTVYTLWAVVSALFPAVNISASPRGEILAGVDNLLLPIAVMMVVHAFVSRAIAVKVLKIVAVLIVALMAVNVLAALWTLITGYAWTAWWSSGETSTAARALTQSRVSGLVNQPAEAGFLYGVGVLCALYLWSNRPRVGYPVILFLAVGGIMTVSKIFLLAVLPLTLWHVVFVKGRRGARQVGLVLAFGGIWAALQAGLFSAWSGAAQLQRALTPRAGQSLLEQATGNRFGDVPTIMPLLQDVRRNSLVGGFGAGGLDVAYDNAWVEAFVVGGLIGAILFTATLVLMARLWWLAPRSSERTLMGSLVLLTAAACLGLPALTANRSATVVWVVLSLLLIALNRRGSNAKSVHGPVPTEDQEATRSSRCALKGAMS